jgi:hypothetical protein
MERSRAKSQAMKFQRQGSFICNSRDLKELRNIAARHAGHVKNVSQKQKSHVMSQFSRLPVLRSSTHLKPHVIYYLSNVTNHMSHITLHTSRITHHASHVINHTSHVINHTSRVTRHTSHMTRHTSCVMRQNSHIKRNPSQVTRHTSPFACG